MFTESQLSEIRYAAENVKNQGELAVYKRLQQTDLYDNAFTDTQWNIILYCAEECKRQHSGEMSVYDMVNAWDYALKDEDWLLEENTLHLTLKFIERIGMIVEPIDNKNGFRTIPIGVTDGMGGWIEKAKWERVPELLRALLESYYAGLLFDEYGRANGWHNENSPTFKAQNAEDMFYYHYEDIHPFRDGNGRSGKILYNYLKGTLENPVMPPNFWGSSNP